MPEKETYHIGLSVYKQGRGKYHWVTRHDEGIIASGDKGTHKKARETGMTSLFNFLTSKMGCH